MSIVSLLILILFFIICIFVKFYTIQPSSCNSITNKLSIYLSIYLWFLVSCHQEYFNRSKPPKCPKCDYFLGGTFNGPRKKVKSASPALVDYTLVCFHAERLDMIAVLLQFAAVCGYALAKSGVRFLVLLTVTWRHTMNVPRRTLTVTLWQYTSQEYPAIPVAKVSETSYERSSRHFQVTLLLWSMYSSSLLQCLAYPQQATHLGFVM